MPKMRMVKMSKIPIARLIEENIDSQASAMLQARILRKKYMRDKEFEDLLKERLRQTDPEAYRMLCEIDKRQDRVIDEILYYAEHIRKINFLSNRLLKRYDVKQKTSPTYHRGQTRNLFTLQGNYITNEGGSMMTEAVEASTTITSLKPYSMSRLTEYERCPRRFYFKYIEKMPEIIEDAGFFGSKVHEAISKALKGQDWQDTLSDLPYKQIEEAEIEYLGETYSIPVEKLKEDINLLKNAQLEQTGKYSFRISPFKD